MNPPQRSNSNHNSANQPRAMEGTVEMLAARITELEIRYTETQRDVESLSSVVLRQQQELEQLRRLLEHYESRLETLTDSDPPRDPLAERPPHY